jgi:DNA protecting protein DprA
MDLEQTLAWLNVKGVGAAKIRQYSAALLPPEPPVEAREKGLACIEWARQERVQILLPHQYPQKLHQLPNPPALLFVRGNIELLDKPSLAIIGTRTPSAPGRKAAEWSAQAASKAGWTVISGGARGVDGIAHQISPHSIAVLPHGFKHCYPPEHKALFEEIALKGCLVSEYLPDQAVSPGSLLARDRLIAALACKVLPIEASASGGGTWYTTQWAFRLGRPVGIWRADWIGALSKSGDPSFNKYAPNIDLTEFGRRDYLQWLEKSSSMEAEILS